jgi:hypothetical protein
MWIRFRRGRQEREDVGGGGKNSGGKEKKGGMLEMKIGENLASRHINESDDELRSRDDQLDRERVVEECKICLCEPSTHVHRTGVSECGEAKNS